MDLQINHLPEEEVIYIDRSGFYRGVLAFVKKLFML